MHLLETLLRKRIYACGTAWADRRGFPAELKSVRLQQQGDFVFRQKGNLVATVWRDKKNVVVLSMMTSADEVTTVERKQRDGSVQIIPCPTAVDTYNKFMNGVDQGDQLRDYYRVHKYYKYIFWFMFDVAITNGYILSAFIPTTLTTLSFNTLKQFCLNLASQLIANYCSRKRAGRPQSNLNPPPPLPTPDNGGPPSAQAPRMQFHLPSHGRSKRCVYCQWYHTPTIRKESVWHCQECPV